MLHTHICNYVSSLIISNSKEHIRHCLLYEYQLGHSATEATRNICQAVGQDSTTLRTALNWFDRFRNQDYSLQDMARSGRPTTINLDELKQLLERDPSLTTTAVALTPPTASVLLLRNNVEANLLEIAIFEEIEENVRNDFIEENRDTVSGAVTSTR